MRDPDIEETLRAMGRVTVPPAPLTPRRADVVDAMVRAAGGTVSERKPRRPRAAVIALSLAAAFAFGVFAWRGHRPTAIVAPEPSSIAYAHRLAGEVVVLGASGVATASPPGMQGVALREGDRVATLAEGRATVHLRETAAATLAPNTELAIAGVATECSLRIGTVAFDVVPLGAAARFVVHTPDSDVVVHGTSFRVTVGERDGALHSEVAVSSGVVVVHGRDGEETRLVAGGHWPSTPAETVKPASAPEPGATETPRRPSIAAPAPSAASELADQNRLLADAALAGKRGDTAAEAQALDSFVQRFPKSPGAHDAIAARMRLAARNGDAGAASAAARRYLVLFPNGPLRDEAIARVAGGKPP